MKNGFIKLILTLTASFFAGSLYAQLYQKPNERLILSFNTTDNKQVSLCADSNLRYMIYRQGTKTHVDYEYPADSTENSIRKFKWEVYSSSERFPFDEATAKQAKPSDYYPSKYYKLVFEDNKRKYMIYQFASEKYLYNLGEHSVKTIWVSIIDINTGKETDLDAVLSTRKGSLRLLITLPGLELSDLDL